VRLLSNSLSLSPRTLFEVDGADLDLAGSTGLHIWVRAQVGRADNLHVLNVAEVLDVGQRALMRLLALTS